VLRLTNQDSAALLNKTNGAGISIAGPVVSVTISAVDSANFSPGSGVAELKRMDSGFETIVAEGTVTLIRGVHRT
jgi:hypothetical protein